MCLSILSVCRISRAEEPVMFGAIGNVIVTIDLTTGDATPLGTTPDFADVRAMAYDSTTDTLYGTVDPITDPKLVTIDRDTGEATVIGPIDVIAPVARDLHQAEALAFNPQDGFLYAAGHETPFPQNFRSSRLLIVDPTTGNATEIAQITNTLSDEADSLEFIDGTLYAIDSSFPTTFLYRGCPIVVRT